MTYASDLGLEVGSKIKVSGDSLRYSSGDILQLTEDDGSETPKFTNLTTGRKEMYFTVSIRNDDVTWEHYKEEKEMTETKKLKFPCCVPTAEIKDEETFKKILDLFVANGATKVEMMYSSVRSWANFGVDHDKKTMFYDYISSYSDDDDEEEVTVYKVEDLLAMISGEETSTAETATLLPIGTAVKISESSKYYCENSDINPQNLKGTIMHYLTYNDFVYHVAWDNGEVNSYKLGDLVVWEDKVEPVAEVEFVLSKTQPTSILHSSQLDNDTSKYSDYKIPEEPLVAILKDVTYKVIIKGYDITLSQDELNELVSELQGFEDYE